VKKGISLVSLVIVVIIMSILAGVVLVTGTSSFRTAELSTYAVEILNIQNAVDEYHFRYDKYPVGEEITLDISQVKEDFRTQFAHETISDSKIKFKVVDLSLIGISNTEYGNNITVKDAYVVSETTGKVYYLQGLEHEDKIYYTLTAELYDVSNTTNNVQTTSNDIKVYDVIFTPSVKETTAEPITVTVRLPKQATINNITTTNNKSVSEQTIEGAYTKIQINETSTDKTGNYEIIVNYTYNNSTKTAKYNVENYDSTLPTITYTEQINGDLKTVQVSINSNGSEIKTVKYEQEIVANKTYFKNYGKTLTNNKFVIDKDGYFTIYVETTAGAIVTVDNIPEEWRASVIDIVDGVPIPKGFTASNATGENTKNGGLVIYEGTDYVTDANVETAKRTRNQYVWVPVAKEEFTTAFKRGSYDNTTYSNALGTGSWEVVLDTTTNMPLAEQDSNYVTEATLKEVQAMYASVKKYEGFYIARYEAGLDNDSIGGQMELEDKLYSMMGKFPYNFIAWAKTISVSEEIGGAVEASRKLYPKSNLNYGVVSTLTYGVQWDTVINWWLKVGAKVGNGNTITSIEDTGNYGNYSTNIIELSNLNEGAKYLDKDATVLEYKKVKEDDTKPSGTIWLLTTGALKVASINNIYDMAGNLSEWTMEGNGSDKRVRRGGSSYGASTVNSRSSVDFFDKGNRNISFRVSLYIK